MEPPIDQAPSPLCHHCEILLVEDSLVNQKLAIGILEKHGHSVVVANTGKEAIAALESDPFDVVLMDVEMPDMDGLEATAVIRIRNSRRENMYRSLP